MITRVAWLTAVAIVGCTDAASAPRSRCVDRPVGVWKAISDAPAKTLRRIDRPAAVWLDDRVWIWDGAGPLTASRFYDTCTDAWLPSGLPRGADKLVADGPQAFRVGNKLMIAGMDEGSGFHVLVFDRAAWKTIKTPGAFEVSPLVVRTDDRLIAWSPAAAWIFDLAAQKWSRMSQRGEPMNAGDSYSCGAATKDKWFVWDDGELLRYGFASNTWSRLASVTMRSTRGGSTW